MKTCKKCGAEKKSSEFYRHKGRKDGLGEVCKVCRRQENKERYLIIRHDEKYKADRRRRTREELASHKQLLIDIRLKYGCAFCSENELCTFDFHHHGPKEFSVAQALYLSNAKFVKEINKCVVVCVNCHKKIHAGLLQVSPSMLCNETL